MEFVRCAPMKDDVLHFIRFLYMDVFKYKATKYVLAIVFAFHSIMFILQTLMFVENFNTTYFMQYMPSYIVCIIAQLSIVILYKVGDVVTKCMENIKLWSPDSASPKFQAKILRVSQRFTFFGLANALLSLILAADLFLSDKHEAEIFYAYNIFKKWFPGQETWLCIFYKPILISSMYCWVALMMNIVYWMFHIRFQRYLVVYYIKNMEQICQITDRKETDLFYDAEFQENIRKLSIVIIDRWNWILINVTTGLDEIQAYLVIGSIFILSYGISLPGLLITIPHLITDDYFKIFTTFCLLFSLCGCWFSEGQKMENVQEYAFACLTQLKWYNHSKTNKLTLLLSLSFMHKPKQLIVYGSTAVNHNFGYQMLKVVYSVVSCIVTLNMKAKKLG